MAEDAQGPGSAAGSSSRRNRVRLRPSGNPPAEARVLHGRRKGKPLRPAQARLLAEVLPALTVDLGRLEQGPAGAFGRELAGFRLEIGFGAGEHLVSEALRNRDVGFIGCEPFVNGVARAVQLVVEAGLDNVRIHPDEAGILIDALPAACLDGVDLLYPDPWPKWRHRKRRFVSDAMLLRLARVMHPGAELHFATDIDDYAAWTLARIARSAEFEWRAKQALDWLTPWPEWVQTRYEAKARAQGRGSAYLTFARR